MNEILIREASRLVEKYQVIGRRILEEDPTAITDLKSALEEDDILASNDALAQALSNLNYREFPSKILGDIGKLMAKWTVLEVIKRCDFWEIEARLFRI